MLRVCTLLLTLWLSLIATIQCYRLPFLANPIHDDYVCCISDEWEGLMFLDYGTVFIDSNTAFAYMNGTVHTGYSFDKKKVYFDIKGFEESPLIPKPVADDSTILYDFDHVSKFLLLKNQ